MSDRLPIWLGEKYEHIGLRDMTDPRSAAPTCDVRKLEVVGITLTGRLELRTHTEGVGWGIVSIDLRTAKELIHDGIWKQVFDDKS